MRRQTGRNPNMAYPLPPKRTATTNNAGPVLNTSIKQIPLTHNQTITASQVVDLTTETSTMAERSSKFIQWVFIKVSQLPKNYSKGRILDIILENVGDRKFIPGLFSFTSPTECTFSVMDCQGALKILREKKFICTPSDGGIPIKLEITSTKRQTSVPYLRVVKSILVKSIDGTTINLNKFYANDVFVDFYFPLSHTPNQMIIKDLLMEDKLGANITVLSLKDNKLTEVLDFDFPTTFPNLKTLDLSNNLITKISKLVCLKGYLLDNLHLDGNPLCNDYFDVSHYVETIRMIFPTIKKVDGYQLANNVPFEERHFLCHQDGMQLVDKFLEMYFSLFDSHDRELLNGLYREDAIFTISCKAPLVSQDSNKIVTFMNRSRNLLKTGITYKKGNVHVGASNILRCLTSFPTTEHDSFSFNVDVPIFEDRLVSIIIMGVFKLPSGNLAKEEPIISFSRSFLLVRDDYFKYTIINDMLNLIATPPYIQPSVFKVTKLTKNPPSIEPVGPLSQNIKEGMVKLFEKLTKLDNKRAEKCLNNWNWKFKSALENFILLEKRDEIHLLDN